MLPTLVAAAAGEYDTVAQYERTPLQLRKKPVIGEEYEWLDRQHGVFEWVTAPALGTHVLYLEWRGGGPSGPISRQRIWVFRYQATAGWVMDFYTLADPAPFARATRGSTAFESLRTDQLVSYGPSCALRSVNEADYMEFSIPASCSIVSRSGAAMRLEATVRFESDRILYREAGVRGDGSIVFRVPGQNGLAYAFQRVP